MRPLLRLASLSILLAFSNVEVNGQGACCTASLGLGCASPACSNLVCSLDAWCCSFEWDAMCATTAITNANAGGPCAGVSNCPGSSSPGPCCTANGSPGCDNSACQVAICAIDIFCCSTQWDGVCATAAITNANSGGPCSGVSNCPGTPGGGGCAPGVGGGAIAGSGSIQIQQGLSPSQLITDVFLGECLSASNVQFTGSTAAIGTFSNGWRIGIASGIILTTGSAALAVGPNALPSAGQDNFAPGHPLLTNLAGTTTYDASVLQFSFVPETEQVTFTYVFASDEYPEYVCSNFNDVFGFFVSGPGYAPNTNIAIIPGTSLPVAINSVNTGVVGLNGTAGGCSSLAYSGLYVNNSPGTHNEYDGFTVPLTACINTVPCASYTIIIAIADAFDGVFDSAVFLEAESFSAGAELDIDATADQEESTEENCQDTGFFVFTIDEPLSEDVTLTFTVVHQGDGVFTQPFPISVTFPAGQTSVSIPISAVPGSMGNDLNSVIITLDTSQNSLLGCSCVTDLITATLYFCDPETNLPVSWIGFEARSISGDREVRCTWQTGSELNNDHFIVERSTDIVNWTDIGKVPGSGTTSLPQSYQFVDRSPLNGTAHYRIRQTDLDGATDHSMIRTVQRTKRTGFSVYPNPGPGTFQLSGYEGGELLVRDLSGRRIHHTLLPSGELGLPGAATGWYLIELRREQGREPERIRIIVE